MRFTLATNVKELSCWMIFSNRIEVGSARRCEVGIDGV